MIFPHGTIKINTIVPDSLPWKGIYYDGNPVTITAISGNGFKFLNWGAAHLVPNPDTDSSITINLSQEAIKSKQTPAFSHSQAEFIFSVSKPKGFQGLSSW